MIAYASAGILLDGGSGGGGGWDGGASSYSGGWDGGDSGGWNGGGGHIEEQVQVVRVQEEAHHHHAPAPQIIKVNTDGADLELNCDKCIWSVIMTGYFIWISNCKIFDQMKTKLNFNHILGDSRRRARAPSRTSTSPSCQGEYDLFFFFVSWIDIIQSEC